MEIKKVVSVNNIKNKIIMFDVFGTIVDWRSSLIKYGSKISDKINWDVLVDKWRAAYIPSMEKVRSGEISWRNLDVLHKESLELILKEMNIIFLNNSQKNKLVMGWHKLEPWADSVKGLKLLKKKYTICTLSNGNISLLVNLAKLNDLDWDLIISAEHFKAYKPDKVVYEGACKMLDKNTEDCILVAAHKDDLKAASSIGMKTILIDRPYEYGKKKKILNNINFKPDYTLDNILQISKLNL